MIFTEHCKRLNGKWKWTSTRWHVYVFVSGKATYMYKLSRAISASKLQAVQTFPPHQRVNKAPAVFKEQTYLGKNSRVILWVTHNVRAASLFSWLLFLASLYLFIVRPKICFDRVHLLVIRGIHLLFCILDRSFTFAHVHLKKWNLSDGRIFLSFLFHDVNKCSRMNAQQRTNISEIWKEEVQITNSSEIWIRKGCLKYR